MTPVQDIADFVMPEGTRYYENRHGEDWLYYPLAHKDNTDFIGYICEALRDFGWKFTHFKSDWSELVFSRPRASIPAPVAI